MFFKKLALHVCLYSALAPAADRWHEIRMSGQPAGYLHEFGDTSESRIVINRLGSKVEILAKVRVEEVDGQVASLRAEVSSSAQTTVMEGRVEAGELQLTITAGGKSYPRAIRLTEPLVGPRRGRELALERLHIPGDKLSYNVFSAELGVVATVTSTCLARDADGLRIEESTSGLPGAATVWLDGSGLVQRRTQPSPFGEIEMRLVSEAVARAATAGAELPAEAYHRSIIRSNLRLPEPRLISHLMVRLRHRRPELGWPNLASDRQRVIEQTRDSVTLEIRRDPGERHPAPPPTYLAPNALFQSDDPAVVAAAREATGATADIFKLRDWTARNMRFDAGIAVAPASEVVRNRAGTCFGYSMLLGALARASGVPTRLQMGFVYTGGIWGGHAWIEAYQRGEWIAIDAALVSPRQADAARISFFSSSLEEGTLAGLGSLAQLYGNVEIEILAFTVGGKTTQVATGSKPYTLTDDVYENPWLGIKVRKPAGFRFTNADITWPAPGLLTLEGPNDEQVLLDRIDTEVAAYVASRKIKDSAYTTIPAGSEHWILIVTPKSLLPAARKWLSF
jgi:hypothetical protein